MTKEDEFQPEPNTTLQQLFDDYRRNLNQQRQHRQSDHIPRFPQKSIMSSLPSGPNQVPFSYDQISSGFDGLKREFEAALSRLEKRFIAQLKEYETLCKQIEQKRTELTRYDDELSKRNEASAEHSPNWLGGQGFKDDSGASPEQAGKLADMDRLLKIKQELLGETEVQLSLINQTLEAKKKESAESEENAPERLKKLIEEKETEIQYLKGRIAQLESLPETDFSEKDTFHSPVAPQPDRRDPLREDSIPRFVRAFRGKR